MLHQNQPVQDAKFLYNNNIDFVEGRSKWITERESNLKSAIVVFVFASVACVIAFFSSNPNQSNFYRISSSLFILLIAIIAISFFASKYLKYSHLCAEGRLIKVYVTSVVETSYEDGSGVKVTYSFKDETGRERNGIAIGPKDTTDFPVGTPLYILAYPSSEFHAVL